MKTLKQIKNDVRVSGVEICYDDYEEKRFYLVNLKDGYVFNDGTHINRVGTVKELNELLKEIETEAIV